MRKSLVSLVALGLFAGAPAMAETTTDEATTNQQQTGQQQTGQQQTGQQQTGQQQTGQQQTGQQQTGQQQTGTLGAEQFEEMLAEYEARSEIEARIVRAITPEGHQVLVFVGPENLEPDGSVEAEDSDIRDRFEEGRFSDVVILGEPRLFRADLDEDHYIFALSADQILRFGVQTGGLAGDTDAEMGRDATVLGETDTDTTVEMGQTDTEMQMDPETGTSDQTGTQTGTDTETEMGQTGTDMGQDDTQMGQTGTETETEMGQTGTDMGQDDTQIGQTGTDTETEMGQTGTGSGQTGTQAGQMDDGAETGQVGRALSEPDADRVVSNLEEAGLDDASEFQGRLVKAMSDDNAPVFFVVTSKDMESDAEVDINEDDVREKLEETGLEDVQFIDEAQIVRGNLEDDHVFVLAGNLFDQRGQQQ